MVTALRRAIPLVGTLLLSDCVLGRTVVGGPDIEVVRVAAVAFGADTPERRHERRQPGLHLPALRAQLTASENLAAFILRTGYTVHLRASRCGVEGFYLRQQVAAGGWLRNAVNGRWIGADSGARQDGDGPHDYLGYIPVTTGPGFAGRYGDTTEQYVAHDWRCSDADLCLVISGGDMIGGRHRSNTVRIPAAVIRAALATAPAE